MKHGLQAVQGAGHHLVRDPAVRDALRYLAIGLVLMVAGFFATLPN